MLHQLNPRRSCANRDVRLGVPVLVLLLLVLACREAAAKRDDPLGVLRSTGELFATGRSTMDDVGRS